jgi:hypothetical protein
MAELPDVPLGVLGVLDMLDSELELPALLPLLIELILLLELLLEWLDIDDELLDDELLLEVKM